MSDSESDSSEELGSYLGKKKHLLSLNADETV